MAGRKQKRITEVELEFMHIIWDLGEAAPDDIERILRERGRSVSIGSVRNVLAIMIEKGYLARRKEGKAYFYRAKLGKDQLQKHLLDDLLEGLFEGSESLVVAALLDRREIQPDELERIKRLIDEHERKEEP
jgi:predicted transcriptional regulator